MYVTTYWALITRDLLIFFNTLWCTYKVVKINTAVGMADQEDMNAFLDFEMMLVSVLPHKFFINYLQEEKKTHLPYLQIIHLWKLYDFEASTL